MAKLMAEMGQYKAQMAAEAKKNGFPVQDPSIDALKNKMAQMEGEVKVVREEEKANRGNAAQTAQLLAQERQLVQQEAAAKTQIAAAQATAAVAPAAAAANPAAAEAMQ